MGINMKKILLALLLATAPTFAQDGTNHAIPVFGGPGFIGFKEITPCTGGVVGWVSSVVDPTCQTTLPTSVNLNIPSTGVWFSQNGMRTQRLNDNLLIGGATISDMAFPNVTKDWLSTFQTAAGLSIGSIPLAELGVLTQNNSASASGAAAIVGGAQSLFSTSAGTSSIALSGYAVNNNATLATNAWALYSECHNTVAAVGSCYGFEADVRSTVATTTPTPFQQGNVVGFQIACGAQLGASQDCSAGVQIEPNPQKFKKGIVFGDTSLTVGGGGGNGTAIDFSRNQSIRWANSGPGTDAEIWANATGLNITGTIVAGTPIPVASGGQGNATLTSNGILFGNGTGAVGSNRCTMDSTSNVTCTSASAFTPQFVFTNTTADANSAFFLFNKNRTGGNTNTNDNFGQLTYRGFANGAQQSSASISAIQQAAASGNNIPSRIQIQTSNSAGQLNQTWMMDQNAHISTSQATAPTLTAGCNGAGSAISGTDHYGQFGNQTAAATTCTITFGTAYAATPFCVVSGQQTPVTTYTPGTTTLVVNFASTASAKFNYVCFGG